MLGLDEAWAPATWPELAMAAIASASAPLIDVECIAAVERRGAQPGNERRPKTVFGFLLLAIKKGPYTTFVNVPTSSNVPHKGTPDLRRYP